MNMSKNILKYRCCHKGIRCLSPTFETCSIKFSLNKCSFHPPTLRLLQTDEFRQNFNASNINKYSQGEFDCFKKTIDNHYFKTKLSERPLWLMILGFAGLTITFYEFVRNSSNFLSYKSIVNVISDSGIQKYFTVNAASPIFKSKEESTDISHNTKSSKDSSGGRFRYNFIADVVDKVSDGVVFIEIKDNRRKDGQGRALTMSNGSGFIVDADGLILTNAHVVANIPRASTIMVRLADGREFQGRVEDFDSISDLALLKIKCTGLKTLMLGSSKDVRPGEFVVALGSPLSLSNTITSGVISSVGRASKDLGIRGKDIHYIQTDAAITFGNSGGPLVNLDGEVIAINSMKVTSGISFAIPIDYAKEFLDKMKKKKSFLSKYKGDDTPADETMRRRRYLGITMLSLTPEVITQMQQKGPESIVPSNVSHGILVWRIVVGSPAYHAGLEPGDIVTHVNGHEIHTARDVYRLLAATGDLNMVVNRKGTRYNVTVAPEE